MAHRNVKLTSALFAPAETRVPYRIALISDCSAGKASPYTIPQAALEIKKLVGDGRFASNLELARDMLRTIKATIAQAVKDPSYKDNYLDMDYTPLKKLTEWLQTFERVTPAEEKNRQLLEFYQKSDTTHNAQIQEFKIGLISQSVKRVEYFQKQHPAIALAICRRLLADYPRDSELQKIEEKFIDDDKDPDQSQHPIFWKLKKNIYLAENKETKQLPNVMSSDYDALLLDALDGMKKFFIRRIQTDELGLPLDKKKKNDYLYAFMMRTNIEIEEKGKKYQDKIEKYQDTFERSHATHFSKEEWRRARLESSKDFHSKQYSVVEGFTVCYKQVHEYKIYPAAFLYQKSPTYALDAIDLYCTLANCFLKEYPRSQLSNEAIKSFDMAEELLNEYLLPIKDLPYAYSPKESRIITFFYYTKIQLNYHAAHCAEDYKFFQSNYRVDPLAALDEYRRFLGLNLPECDEWEQKIKVALALPVRKRPKLVLPMRHGWSYVPLSDDEQKANLAELKRSSSSIIEETRNKNLKKIEELFSLKPGMQPSVFLETIIKNICDWQDDFTPTSLLMNITTLASFYFTGNKDNMNVFMQSLIVDEESKKERNPIEVISPKKTAPLKKPVPRSMPVFHPSPSVNMEHIKTKVEKDEREKKAILDAVQTETKTPKIAEKKAVKKKKAKKLTKKMVNVSAEPSVSVPYEAKEMKVAISKNHSSLPVNKKFNIKEYISPGDFFKGILSDNSAARLMELFQDAPFTLQDDRVISGVRFGGSAMLLVLAQHIKPERLNFPLDDIDLHFAQNNFGRSIEKALRNNEFKYESSVTNLFTRYTCSSYIDSENKPIHCELTVVPLTAKKNLNSIPLSRIKAVVEVDTKKIYFADVTPLMVQDILESNFRVDIPSLEAKATHESCFLTRFSNYYHKLVILSQWTIDKDSTRKILTQDFLYGYLNKIKKQSASFFYHEISRLIIWHQKIIFNVTSGKIDHTDKLLNTVLHPMIYAFFSVMLNNIPGLKSENIANCAPVLVPKFLNHIKAAKFPERSSEQSYAEWLLQVLTSFREIKKTEGLTFNIDAIIDGCCAQIIIPVKPVKLGFSSLFRAPSSVRSTSVTMTSGVSPKP